MLEVRDLVVRYGPIQAVSGLTLSAREGETVGIVGRNGAGKTTTLSAIVGLVRPQGGSLSFEDDSLLGEPPERIARRGIGLVPEGRRIFATLTVAENLALGGSSLPNGVSEGAIDEIVARFPVLGRYYSSPAGRLSGGEQQQLAIARALVGRPRLLLLDEPSLGLGPLIVDEVFEILSQLRHAGLTIVLVEQNAHRAIEFADRCYVLRSGRVEFEGERDALLDNERVADAYLGVT